MNVQPASELFLDDTFGILELALDADRYAWKLRSTTGETKDSGVTPCH